MAENPESTSRQLFNWLGLPWSTEVDRFIIEHGKKSDQDPDSIYRKKGSRIARWMKVDSFNDINHIQGICTEAIHLFGYFLVNNSSLNTMEKTFSRHFDSNYSMRNESTNLLSQNLTNNGPSS